jgi:hypothetical protein
VTEVQILDGPFTIANSGSLYVIEVPEGATSKADVIGNVFMVEGVQRRALGVESLRACLLPIHGQGIGVLFTAEAV